MSNLESILKGTAKFKESKNKLEESYNSLMDSFCVPAKNDPNSYKTKKSIEEANKSSGDMIKVFGMNE